MARVLFEDGGKRQRVYVGELLDWSLSKKLPISHKNVYQKVNSSVENAVNNQVGKNDHFRR